MTLLLNSAALLGLMAAALAWRAACDRRLVGGLGMLAVALVAVAAWLARDEAGGNGEPPAALLAESARAFNQFPGAGGMPGEGGTAAGSLPELAERLAARLEGSPDDAAGWSLLAATYRQLGRDEDAAAAEQRAIDAGDDPTVFADQHRMMMGMSGGGGSGSMLQAVTSGSPVAARYVAEGQQLRIQRKFAEAEQAFRKAVEADPTDADSWADLADSAAIAAGRDLIAGREAIEQALRINPQHRKALWLRASLELQEQRYADAATTWRMLSGLVAPDSPDARVIAANVAEADMLSASPDREG